MGFLRAEQNVRNLKKCTFRNSGTPVRRTRRRKSQQNALSGILGFLCAEQTVGNLKNCTFRNSGTPVRRARRQKYQQMHFQEFWDSCAQNKTSDISKNALSGIQVTKTNPLPGAEPFCVGCPLWGPRFEPKSPQIHPRGLFCSSRPDEKTHFAT